MAPEYGVVSFYRDEQFHRLMSRRNISRSWATAHFLTIMVSLGTLMVLVGVSFSLLMPRLTRQVVSWTYLVLICLCRVLGLCHSLKVVLCPLPSLFSRKWSGS